MTKYNDKDPMNPEYAAELGGYREGVDRVLEYIEAIHAYPVLVEELRWAINEGII